MKNKQTKYILLSCGVILVVACLCLGVILLSGLGVSLLWPFEFKEDAEASIPTTETTLPVTPEVSELQEEQNELPDELFEILLQIESEVIQIRGLDQTKPVEKTLISMSELEEIVTNDFFLEYSDQEAEQDVLILAALGLLPEGFNLRDFYLDLYSEQIAGFYDDETEEIYVVQGAEFGGSEKLTYSHEFTHVLQDQVYDLEEGLGLNEEACELDSERCAAVQALIEGDATYTEILWFQTYASREDYFDVMQTFDELESPILDTAPPFMASDLYFPYEKGYVFIEYLYDQDGYDAVDLAYQNPPVSTEQILHPEKYPNDVPQDVALPDLIDVLGNEWQLFDQNVMGEWYTYLILNQAYEEDYWLSEQTASKAAAGWGGDSYAVYLNGNTDEIVFINEVAWDTLADAEEFAEAFEDYADLRWGDSKDEIEGNPTWYGDNSVIIFTRDGDHTLWLLSPNDTILKTILSEFK
ncbi:MAG: hypothetical protein U9R53_10655 [Chloroflexota bacterium]|nr:hypothetical protein [Chloroflexota bacterium]